MKTKRLLFIGTFLILFFIKYHNAYSQSTNNSNFYSLTKVQFFQIIKKDFSSVANSSGKTTIGNYASLDIKESNLSLNTTHNFKNGNMLSLNAKGSVTDGVFAIFDKTKLNSDVEISLKYNFLLNNSSISYLETDMQNLNRTIALYTFDSSIELANYNNIKSTLENKAIILDGDITEITASLNGAGLDSKAKAAFEYQRALKSLQRDSILKTLKHYPSFEEYSDKTKENYEEQSKKAAETFKYTQISYKWVSISGSLQNRNFSLFNDSFISLDSQVTKENNDLWNGSVEYNWYQWNHLSKNTFYFIAGFRISCADNFESLSKIELTDTKVYGNNSTQRNIVKKYNAYKGDYRINQLKTKTYVEYYRFFNKNSFAIHIYPDWQLLSNKHSILNVGVGILYSYIDKTDKENKNKINLEVYFNLEDLADDANTGNNLFGRNELGIRISTPIKFFNF